MLPHTHRPTERLCILVARATQLVLRVLLVCSKVLKYKHVTALVRGARATDVRAPSSARNSVKKACAAYTLANKSFKSQLRLNWRPLCFGT